jgi:hypothetical protein
MTDTLSVKITRQEFLTLPMETRQRILAEQADELLSSPAVDEGLLTDKWISNILDKPECPDFNDAGYVYERYLIKETQSTFAIERAALLKQITDKQTDYDDVYKALQERDNMLEKTIQQVEEKDKDISALNQDIKSLDFNLREQLAEKDKQIEELSESVGHWQKFYLADAIPSPRLKMLLAEARAQAFKECLDYCIEQRRVLTAGIGHLQLTKPNDVSGVIQYGCKKKAFQQVIDIINGLLKPEATQ